MTKPTLESIASAKAKLSDEIRQLEEQEAQLLKEQASNAFSQIIRALQTFGANFDARQRAEISALVTSGPRVAKRAANKGSDSAPKYWLPHSGETWSGRGRPPRAFTAWEGTVAHREWKANHPNEKWPKYPG